MKGLPEINGEEGIYHLNNENVAVFDQITLIVPMVCDRL